VSSNSVCGAVARVLGVLGACWYAADQCHAHIAQEADDCHAIDVDGMNASSQVELLHSENFFGLGVFRHWGGRGFGLRLS
jgi:hypothetical protein